MREHMGLHCGYRVDSGERIVGYLVVYSNRSFIRPLRLAGHFPSFHIPTKSYGFGNFYEVDPSTVELYEGTTEPQGGGRDVT